MLAELFVRQVALVLKLPRRTLGVEAIEKLKRYDFPGNTRELRNLIERAAILSSGNELSAESFPLPAGSEALLAAQGATGAKATSLADALPDVSDLRQFLADAEKALIVRTLQSTNGAQAEAARRLGISRSDLGYKLSKYGINDPAR